MERNGLGYQPLVSVGIPTYNRPGGLSQTLQCIMEQSYCNLEIIVSDNCSTDGETEAIVRKFQEVDKRIRYIRQPVNIGPAANFDYLKNNASGLYFVWAADDDLCESNFIERLVFYLNKDPDLVLVASDVITIGPEGGLICTNELNSIRVGKDFERIISEFFAYPTSNVFFCIYGLYRLSVLRKINTADSLGYGNYGTSSEVPFLAQVSTFGKIASIPEKLKYYRSHQDSVFYREQKVLACFEKMKLDFGIRLKLFSICIHSGFSGLMQLRLLFVVLFSGISNSINLFAEKIKNNLWLVIVKVAKLAGLSRNN